MTNKVVHIKKKKRSALTYIVVSFIAFLVVVKLYEATSSETYLQRKHDVQMLRNPININAHSFYDMNGSEHNFQEFNGNMSIVAFWAPWCGYCAQELPQINKLHKELNDEGISVIPLVKNIEPLANIERFYSKLQLRNIPPYTTSDRRLYERLHINAFPNFILVDTDGYAVARMRPNWESHDILEMFAEIKNLISKQDQDRFLNP